MSKLDEYNELVEELRYLHTLSDKDYTGPTLYTKKLVDERIKELKHEIEEMRKYI